MCFQQRFALIIFVTIWFAEHCTTIVINRTDGLSTSSTTVFKLPTVIDEDDLLHELSLFMKDNMNLSIDACENFYEFACGNWTQSPRVPKYGHNDTFLHTMQLEINHLMVDFLKNYSKSENYTAEDKAKLFYSSCVIQGKDIQLGVKTLLENEYEIFQKLNLTGKNDWMAINFMSPYGVYALLPLYINYSTSTRQFEISINLPTPVLQNFASSPKLNDLFEIHGLDAKEFEVMLQFERNLTNKARELETAERISIRTFLRQHEKDVVNWKEFFKMAFPQHFEVDWYIINKVENFTQLERFFRKSSTIHLRNYIKWRTVLKFFNIWNDQLPDDIDREQICRQHTESYFTYALMPWFIEYLYDDDRREDILKLAEAIQNNFFEIINNNTWLDEESKSNLKTKLIAMDITVGYKDQLKHRSLSDLIYKDVEIKSNWFKNLQNLENYRANIRLNSVQKTIIPPILSPFTVNAYYMDYINTAFITMGISQMPLYHQKFPDSLKFGGIGMLIGHEMAHGFDSNGYLVDYDGKKQKLLSTISLRSFKEHYSCLDNQYNKFIYRGFQTNGSVTMPDNIADNVGLRIAYYSYLKQHSTENERYEKPLPGINFTNNQLFFIKFAQTWCTGRDDSYKIHHIKMDRHAYGEFRVLGTLQNMPEFSETFKCKLGTQMNPLKKCKLW